MKRLVLSLLLIISPSLSANESSIQWYVQPLKVKHQVGKEMMTEVGLYRFPEFMYHTHPGIMLNHICAENRLEEFTVGGKKGELKNVNLANLYGLKVFYDIVKDSTVVDLTKVKQPAGETISEDEVIAMTLECVRLSTSFSRVTILTNEKTKHWKKMAERLSQRDSNVPIYTLKTVPLKLAKRERLYHTAFWPVERSENVSGPIGFLTHGGDTAYSGIGLSKKLTVSDNGKDFYQSEFNPLAGFTFSKKAGVITITAPQSARNSAALMKQAIECVKLTAKAKGENPKNFKLVTSN